MTAADLSGANLRGALLIGADLSHADLRLADLTGADLRAADLRGASLAETLFLTQPQLDAARGDAGTTVPPSLIRPAHWSSPGCGPASTAFPRKRSPGRDARAAGLDRGSVRTGCAGASG